MWGLLIGYCLGKQDAEERVVEEEKPKRRSLGYFEPTVEEKKRQKVKNFIAILLAVCLILFLICSGWAIYTEAPKDDISELVSIWAKFLVFPAMVILSSTVIAFSSLVLLRENRKIFVENKIERFEKI